MTLIYWFLQIFQVIDLVPFSGTDPLGCNLDPAHLIAEGYSDKDLDIKNINTFDILKQPSQNDKKR